MKSFTKTKSHYKFHDRLTINEKETYEITKKSKFVSR